MATVKPVDPPWEGAIAYKIDRTDEPRGERYEITIRGPWDDEPDKIQWVDPTTDLDCLMVRNMMGNWCGYVGVPSTHPAYGVGYSECLLGADCTEEYCYEHSLSSQMDVHGGLTFADKCSGESEDGGPSAGICHVPLDGRPHDIWWQGFDCGHAMDFSPGMYSMEMATMPDILRKYGKDKPYVHEEAMKAEDDWSAEKYRDMAYVRAECSGLAAQLASLPLSADA